MSGGAYDYSQRRLGEYLFGYSISVDYGDEGFNESKKARKINPMEDRDVSELVWDVLCLIHSKDWYDSGDTGRKDYLDDVTRFKQKWFNRPIEAVKEDYINDLRLFCDELIDEINRIGVE